MSKKSFAVLLAILLVGFVFSGGNIYAEYPERAIEAINQYSAGGSTDAVARVYAEFLEKQLGQPVVVVNKPGGAGAVAGNELYKKAPDGYTIGTFNTNQPTPEYGVKPERFVYKSSDIVAVAQWSGYATGIFVGYDAPWKNLKEFVDYAKKNPNKVKWGHSGRGNLWWITGSVLCKVAGISMLDVPFEGDGPNLTALLGGHVDMSILTCGASQIEQIKAKKIRAIAIAVPKRHELLPDVPTAAEQGFDLGIPAVYLGTFVRVDTPKSVISKLDQATKAVCQNEAFRKKMDDLGMPVWYASNEQFGKLVYDFGQAMYKLLKELDVLK